jgi:coenzyme F420-reducing hydrogenase delta subunit
VQYAQKLLEEVGIEGDRLNMYNIGASDAPLFAQAANEMTERARKYGPNPIKKRRKQS